MLKIVYDLPPDDMERIEAVEPDMESSIRETPVVSIGKGAGEQ